MRNYTQKNKTYKGTEHTKQKTKLRNIEHTYKEYYKTPVEQLENNKEKQIIMR